MAPAAAAPAAANRRARNITESASPTPFQTASPEPGPSRTGRKRPRPSYAEADDDDDDGDDDDDDNEEVEEDEQDGEGEEVVDIEEEEEDGEGEAEVEEVEDDEVMSSQVVSDDLDQAPSPSPEPILLPRRSGGSMKIRLNLGNGPLSNPDRGQRAAAKKAGKKTKKVALDALASDNDDEAMLDEDDIGSDVDMGEEASTRSGSPSKLTARQRAMGNKNNKELHDSLLALHYDAGAGGKKLELSEAERLQKREEMARRRKRQNDQRLQDEQDQTINRLLRAQTGRSRAKLDAPTADPSAATSRMPSPSVRARRHADTLRWTCRLVHGRMDVRVGVPSGKEAWISLTSTEPTGKRDASGVCAVEGCGKGRKYRCVRDFERGGCSMEHLKLVEASLKV